MTNPSNDIFDSEEFKDNLRLFSECEKSGKDCILPSMELTDIAEYYFEKGQVDHAREIAEYAVSLYPSAPEPNEFLARYYIIVRRDAATAQMYMDKVETYDELEDFTLAAEIKLFQQTDSSLQEAISILLRGEEEVDEDQLQNYYIDAAHTLLDYNHVPEAKEWFEKLTDNGSSDYLELKARILYAEGHPKEAIEIIEKILDANPFNTDYWHILATTQINNGMYRDAVSSCDYAIAIDPDNSEAYLNKGNALFKLGEFEQAITCYETFSRMNDNELGLILQARCHLCLKNVSQSLQLLRQAEERCTENYDNRIDILKDYAMTYASLGNSGEAMRYIDKLRQMGAEGQDIDLVEGGVYLSMRDFDKARDVLESGYIRSGKSTEYLFQAAVTYYENCYDVAAYMLFKEVDKLMPEHPMTVAYLAVLSKSDGDREAFLSYLKRAMERCPDDLIFLLREDMPQGMSLEDFYKNIKDSIS